MKNQVDEKLVSQFAKIIAKDIMSEADLGDFSKLFKKIVVEIALDAELTEHLSYEKNDPSGTGNSCNQI